jgi:Zn-dependent peptidase ImmA (M78 family)
MSPSELLEFISKGRKPVPMEAVFSDLIDPAILKRIDKVFNKGLHYYLDPKSPDINLDASIFFRKSVFETELNFSARRIINQYEDFKLSLSALSKLAKLKIERKLPIVTINQDPKIVANNIRNQLYPRFKRKKKDFLTSLIFRLAEVNILVFEFVEPAKKKEKANFHGVFISPNVIVLKRLQDAFSREIFTLIHELGHYLLNIEEAEEVDVTRIARTDLSLIEKWCNDFAYHFLIGEFDKEVETIEWSEKSIESNRELIDNISEKTNLSRLAIYTRLLLRNKISYQDYHTEKEGLQNKYDEWKKSRKLIIEQKKAEGKIGGGGMGKSINSPLLVTTIQVAFHEGLINEYEVCNRLKIQPDKLDKYLQ